MRQFLILHCAFPLMCIYTFVSSQFFEYALCSKFWECIKGHRYQICLNHVDITSEQCFVKFYSVGVMQYCLLYNKKIMISQLKQQSPGNAVVYCTIRNTGSTHANPICHTPDIDLIYGPILYFVGFEWLV